MSQFSTLGINTFGVDHACKSISTAYNVTQLTELLRRLRDPVIIGGGSNVLFTRDIDRPVILIEIPGIDIVGESVSHVMVRAGAGIQWHRLVQWAVSQDYGGIENLSLIPGKCGAAPMQNIGAYGVELKDVFVDLDAIAISGKMRRKFTAEECDFGYRHSVFKSALRDEYIITHITLKLTKPGHHFFALDYGAIRDELDARKVKNPEVAILSRVISDIRRSKLPDPTDLPNAGSFFKNPIISLSVYHSIAAKYERVPHYPVDEEHVKVPAGWLIERCGWKGKREGMVGTHVEQALVIVNYGTRDGSHILAFSKKVAEAIKRTFDIDLDREVNLF